MGRKRDANKAKSNKRKEEDKRQQREDLISKLPDDILARILSLVAYKFAVRASATSRRWKNLHLQLPDVILHFQSRGAGAMRSMERMLRRRRQSIQRLRVVFGADAPPEREHAATFIELADAPTLEVWAECGTSQDLLVGDWSLELPPSTAALTLLTADFAIRRRLPQDAGAGRCGDAPRGHPLVIISALPALPHLTIRNCTLGAGSGMVVTSAAMPRLKHLRIVDVTIVDAGRPGSITVDAEELAPLHMSCRTYCRPLRRDEPQWSMYHKTPPQRASHTVYSAVHLRAPKLRALSWRVCWAYDVRIHGVPGSRVSDVDVELAYGVMPRIAPEDFRTITEKEAHALMKSILAGLWPGLRHLGVSFNKLLRDVRHLHKEQKLICHISAEEEPID
ncbi:hypothetical protein EJB05_57307, partial [Eragrostis curvula]